MIVSFRHRFVFVAIPKTASHAFRAALRPHLDGHDWEQCVLFEPRFFPIDALARLGHGHVSCREIRPFLPPDFWDPSIRFCTVRNPYDRFVSYCYFVNRDNGRMQNDPLGTMKRALDGAQPAGRVLLRPQSEFVCDDGGGLLVTHVCRFEALQADFNRLCGRLQLPASPLPLVNRGPAPRRALWDDELKEMIRAVYHRDFALFDYAAAPSGCLEP